MPKIGRFSISTDAIREDPDFVKTILDRVRVTHKKVKFRPGLVEYEGYCDDFDDIKGDPPEYIAVIEYEDGPVFKGWERVR